MSSYSVTGKDILKAIDLANAIRSVGKFKKVNDLLPGIESDPEACVLANTFNCECRVEGNNPDDFTIINKDKDWIDSAPNWDDNNWYVWFFEEKYAKALAKELKNKVYIGVPYVDQANYEMGIGHREEPEPSIWGVKLPKRVGNIATQFDNGDLDKKYYLGR